MLFLDKVVPSVIDIQTAYAVFDLPASVETVAYLVSTVIAAILLIGFILWKVLQAHQRKPDEPIEKLTGMTGRVVKPMAPGRRGKVHVYGEVWDAESEQQLAQDQEVEVLAVDKTRRVLRVAAKVMVT